jgi:hypothetical protein
MAAKVRNIYGNAKCRAVEAFERSSLSSHSSQKSPFQQKKIPKFCGFKNYPHLCKKYDSIDEI